MSRLWVGRRQDPILGYVSKTERKKFLGCNGLIAQAGRIIISTVLCNKTYHYIQKFFNTVLSHPIWYLYTISNSRGNIFLHENLFYMKYFPVTKLLVSNQLLLFNFCLEISRLHAWPIIFLKGICEPCN